MCLLGIIAYPPGPRIAALPSFISIFADPLVTMTCSFGVCQCQGIRQPAVPFADIMDGPLEGSPLWTAAVVHEGNPGNGSNLFSDIFRRIPMSSALATNTQARTARTNFIS